MAKKLYVCEVCGKRNDKTKVICCNCVERDLLSLIDRFNKIEKRVSLLEDPLNEIFVDKHPIKNKYVKSEKDDGGKE